jgi:hypothetical protein
MQMLGTSWRTSVDRAWRSEPLRRKFEAEWGLHPLGDSPEDQTREALEGYTATYHDRFLVWATKRRGLEREAPDAIRKKLVAGH